MYPMTQERRQSFRVEWNSPATIYDGEVAHSCVLSNFSNAGAKITGVGSATLPDEFLLSITPHGRKRKCRVRWRIGEAIGVEFTDRGTRLDELESISVREPAP